MHFLILGGLFLGLGPSVWLTDATSYEVQLHLQFFSMADDGYYVVWQPPEFLRSPEKTARQFWQIMRRRRWHTEEKLVINFSPRAYGAWMELRAINPEAETMVCDSNVGFHPSAKTVLVAMGCRWEP